MGWALAREERWILTRLGAVLVPKGERYESKLALKDMAIAAGMAVAPAFHEIDVDGVNAFAVHAIGRRPVLGVTRGMLEDLTVDEQRAVLRTSWRD